MPASPLSLTDAVARFFLAKDYTPRSLAWMHTTLQEFVGFARVKGVTQTSQVDIYLLRGYTKWLQETPRGDGQHLASATVLNRCRAVRAFIAFGVQDEAWFDANVLMRWKMPREEDKTVPVLSPEQVDKLFAAARSQPHEPTRLRNEAVLAVLLDTGIRVAELCNLTVDDVRLEPSWPHLHLHRKGRKQQDVPLGKQATRALQRYLGPWARGRMLALPPGARAIRRKRVPREDEPALFLSRDGEPLRPLGVNAILTSLAESAGREHFAGVRVSPHTLRHTFAVRFLDAGGSLHDLQRLMGHASLRNTERYMRTLRERRAGGGLSVYDTLYNRQGRKGQSPKGDTR